MKIRTLALLLAATSALAGSQAFAATPYTPVVATYDTAGADDAELKAFIDSLQKAIDGGDAAFLKLQVAKDLLIYAPPVGFPDATTPGPLANPDKHEGEQRLDEAAILMGSADVDYTRDDLDSMVIDLFGTAIEPRTVGKSKIAGDRLCSPAEPIFDRDKALEMAAAADVPPGNLWILSDKTDFHEKPDAKSPVIETLPANSVVPFIEGSVDVPPADGGATAPDTNDAEAADDGGWYSVALPSGKTGYASDDASLGFQAVSVCYGKVEGHWAVTAVMVPSL
ncbi:hypothetical protein SAMN02745157_3139 [Kaistia soli DSM 19436]|uniref:Uncharacterized protein n=1 Tax=Kaistia soli DSM 19436 TaxID=1122133 RepID=A0A1M5FS62_9HYPH|nr:SH3 domain-containing protein [Kaistia soli]SHF94021.1 hypothetical protein SAMN02745157_3139 [Kaistia soli DSM 19436]